MTHTVKHRFEEAAEIARLNPESLVTSLFHQPPPVIQIFAINPEQGTCTASVSIGAVKILAP